MHVVLQHCVKLCKRCDGIHVKGIKPALFERPEMAFYLAFGGPITDAGMQKQDPKGYTDHGKLFVGIAAAIVNVEFIRNPISGDGIFKYFLEVVCIVIVKQPAADKETGMVVNDHDAVDPPGMAVFCDVWQIAGVSACHIFPKASSS